MSKANPQRTKELRIKRLFNISMEEYNLLGKTCPICGRVGKTRENPVDHNHKTGLVRGRPCVRCNKGISVFGDDWKLLIMAASYLSCPPALSLIGERFGRTGRVNKKVGKKKKK